jgi:hypothetical protein
MSIIERFTIVDILRTSIVQSPSKLGRDLAKSGPDIRSTRRVVYQCSAYAYSACRICASMQSDVAKESEHTCSPSATQSGRANQTRSTPLYTLRVILESHASPSPRLSINLDRHRSFSDVVPAGIDSD